MLAHPAGRRFHGLGAPSRDRVPPEEGSGTVVENRAHSHHSTPGTCRVQGVLSPGAEVGPLHCHRILVSHPWGCKSTVFPASYFFCLLFVSTHLNVNVFTAVSWES